MICQKWLRAWWHTQDSSDGAPVRPNLIVRRAQKVADADMRSEGGLSRRKRGCWRLRKYPGISDRVVMEKNCWCCPLRGRHGMLNRWNVVQMASGAMRISRAAGIISFGQFLILLKRRSERSRALVIGAARVGWVGTRIVIATVSL